MRHYKQSFSLLKDNNVPPGLRSRQVYLANNIDSLVEYEIGPKEHPTSGECIHNAIVCVIEDSLHVRVKAVLGLEHIEQ